jgi:hypothetical protein
MFRYVFIVSLGFVSTKSVAEITVINKNAMLQTQVDVAINNQPGKINAVLKFDQNEVRLNLASSYSTIYTIFDNSNLCRFMSISDYGNTIRPILAQLRRDINTPFLFGTYSHGLIEIQETLSAFHCSQRLSASLDVPMDYIFSKHKADEKVLIHLISSGNLGMSVSNLDRWSKSAFTLSIHNYGAKDHQGALLEAVEKRSLQSQFQMVDFKPEVIFEKFPLKLTGYDPRTFFAKEGTLTILQGEDARLQDSVIFESHKAELDASSLVLIAVLLFLLFLGIYFILHFTVKSIVRQWRDSKCPTCSKELPRQIGLCLFCENIPGIAISKENKTMIHWLIQKPLRFGSGLFSDILIPCPSTAKNRNFATLKPLRKSDGSTKLILEKKHSYEGIAVRVNNIPVQNQRVLTKGDTIEIASFSCFVV